MLDYQRGVLFCRGNALHDDEMSLLFMLIVSGSVIIIFLTRFFTGFLFSYVIGRLNTTSINTDVNGPILHSGIGYWGG